MLQVLVYNKIFSKTDCSEGVEIDTLKYYNSLISVLPDELKECFLPH